jgi:tetratricopeptide (TPR) repeat protein
MRNIHNLGDNRSQFRFNRCPGLQVHAIVCTVALLILCTWTANAQAPPQTRAAMEGLGVLAFATSCKPSTQQEFERGVALLHSFSYAESEEAFRAVIAVNPRCAIAHWGVAMSRFHELWSPPGPDDLRTGWTEINEAQRENSATVRETEFVGALAAFYRNWDRVPHTVRARAYSDAMAGVARNYPQDIEAQAFYALSLIAIAPPDDRSHTYQKRAAAILEPIFRDHPDHPGAAHYLIHAYDSTELAARGLVAARAYSKIAPFVPHALHMPSHIFTRLGLWRDSIASNLAAWEAAKHHGDVGEELHAMDYLTYAYLQRGLDIEAERVVAALGAMTSLATKDFKVSYAATAMPVRLAIERHRWSDAERLQALPGASPPVSAIVYWARAVADARADHPQPADSDIAAIETCRQELLATGDTYWATQVDILVREATAWQLDARTKAENAVQLLREAANEEDSLEKLPVTPGPIIPAREQLGEMLLAQERPAEALKEFQSALSAAPGRRGALLGAIRAAELAADSRAAARLHAVLANE